MSLLSQQDELLLELYTMRTLTIFRSEFNIGFTLQLDNRIVKLNSNAVVHHDIEHLLYGLDYSRDSEVSIHRHTVGKHLHLIPSGKLHTHQGDHSLLCQQMNPAFDVSEWVQHFDPTLVGFKYMSADFLLQFELYGRKVINTRCLV